MALVSSLDGSGLVGVTGVGVTGGVGVSGVLGPGGVVGGFVGGVFGDGVFGEGVFGDGGLGAGVLGEADGLGVGVTDVVADGSVEEAALPLHAAVMNKPGISQRVSVLLRRGPNARGG